MLTLRTLNLTVGYKSKKINNVAGPLNFTLSKNNLYGLIGVNGVGKSTLLRSIGGLLSPLKGKVILKDQDVFKLSFQERAKYISLVLTERVANGLATVEEIVKMGRYPYTNWQFKISTIDQKFINTAIKSTGMVEHTHTLFSELSDGNKQKVMIAKALAQDTPLLILDEPTAHLDIKNKFIILELLKKICKEQEKIIIISGHDLDYMLAFCDQLILMTPSTLSIESPKEIIKNNTIYKTFGLNTLPSIL